MHRSDGRDGQLIQASGRAARSRSASARCSAAVLSCIACSADRSRPEQNASPAPASTSTRQPLGCLFHRGNQLHLHLGSHRVAPLRPMQSNRPYRCTFRDHNRLVIQSILLRRSRAALLPDASLTIAQEPRSLRRSPHWRGSIRREDASSEAPRRTPSTPRSMFPWECFPPAHPAQTGIRQARRWPHQTACNPPRMPRERGLPLRRAAHEDARRSRSRDARRARQRLSPRFARALPAPPYPQARFARACVDQRAHASDTASDAPRVAIRISEGHGEIGHHARPASPASAVTVSQLMQRFFRRLMLIAAEKLGGDRIGKTQSRPRRCGWRVLRPFHSPRCR